MFLLKASLYGIAEGTMTSAENYTAYALIALYYILYFNSMYKFSMSFYNIMRNVKIDECDAYKKEIIGTSFFGLFCIAYGFMYNTSYYSPNIGHYGSCWMGLGVSILILCFLLWRYFSAGKKDVDEVKKNE